MAKHNELKREMLPLMVIFTLLGVLFIFIKNDDLNEAAVFTKQNVSFANLAINGMAEHRTGFRSYDDTDDILQQLEV